MRCVLKLFITSAGWLGPAATELTVAEPSVSASSGHSFHCGCLRDCPLSMYVHICFDVLCYLKRKKKKPVFDSVEFLYLALKASTPSALYLGDGLWLYCGICVFLVGLVMSSKYRALPRARGWEYALSTKKRHQFMHPGEKISCAR